MPHTIRLRGPWQLRPAPRTDSAPDVATRRVTMPCAAAELWAEASAEAVSLERRFQRPTGLTPSSQVMLAIAQRLAATDGAIIFLVGIALNGSEIDAPAETAVLRMPVHTQLQPSNVLELRVEVRQVEVRQLAADRSVPAEFGDVWLEIED